MEIFPMATMDNRRIKTVRGSEFELSEVTLVDKSGIRGWIQKDLVANNPIEATLVFSNVNKQILSISRLEISGWSEKLSYFPVKLYNINIQ